MSQQRGHRGAGGDGVVVTGENLSGSGKGDGGGRGGRGWDERLQEGIKRKTPGLVHR